MAEIEVKHGLLLYLHRGFSAICTKTLIMHYIFCLGPLYPAQKQLWMADSIEVNRKSPNSEFIQLAFALYNAHGEKLTQNLHIKG